MKKTSEVAKLLREIFSANAIQCAAISEQLEDVRFCVENRMNHLNGGKEKAKWDAKLERAKQLAAQDNTFTDENIRRFQRVVDEYLSVCADVSLYADLTEEEHFAVRRFYYLGRKK